MTAHYFMLLKDGADLSGLTFPPFTVGAGPTTVDRGDAPQAVGTVRTNLLTNPSFEVDMAGWTSEGSAGASRVTDDAYVGSASCLVGIGGNLVSDGFYLVTPGKTYTLQARLKTTYGYLTIYWCKSNGAVISATTQVFEPGEDTWTRCSITGSAPSTAAKAKIAVESIGAEIRCDALMLEQTSIAGGYFDGDTADDTDSTYAWTGTAHQSTSTETNAYSDDPADLDGRLWIWQDSVDDLSGRRPAAQSMPWPGGFYRSAFRAVRDPAVVGDDSGNTLGTQVYDHGWLIAERLAAYFTDTRNGHHPTYDSLTWPPQEDFTIVPVTGTPAASDSRGWHGLESVTWPGSSAGVGTLRQLLSGDEGTTRKVATIIDRLAATTSGQRTTIGDQYSADQTAILAAAKNLATAAGAGLRDEEWSAAQAQYHGRVQLNAMLAQAAVPSASGQAVSLAMAAITAKECGLIGATFTSLNYETMTAPIDAVLAMPSDY
ncbi:MAG: carbohydrate binding domain-containing protein [Nocardioidaceae bacterium]|nr:carbohydrate binding domain-containing protein [Nocardioidaceae bacterium]